MIDRLARALAALRGRSAATEESAAAGQGKQDLFLRFAAPGHYYSPIPSYAEIERDQDRIFDAGARELPGVRVDEARIRERLAGFARFNAEFPYTEEPDPALRFALENTTYSRGDAAVLYSMMRLIRPKRIVEIGSGASTWLMLDVNERFLGGKARITSLDPHPERMVAGLHDGDRERMEVLPVRVQDASPATFAGLAAGDILFVDSTHVSRCDSDVNHILFSVLPALAPGVLVHFHDVFWPFEYPKHWLLEIGAAWNEAYLLRAFLQYNNAFEIDFFSDYATQFMRQDVERAVPVFLKGPGSSLWLRRVQ
ncbi:MAG: class I SAM-dependent methyltransferase [Betaproteobacteria bacterium]|nr:class I SAM-dependent methyltransferase [Betaproteobacteria bacterium]